jgi:hypothetical protein
VGPFWRRIAKLAWPTAGRISGTGPFASLCGCKGWLTVYLYSTLEAAREGQEWVKDHATGRTWNDAGTHGVSDLRWYIAAGFVRVERQKRSLSPVAVPQPPVPLPPDAAQRMLAEMTDYVRGEQEKFLRHYAGGHRDKNFLRHFGLDPRTAMWSRFLQDVRATLDRSVARWRERVL